ncbi:MAG: hypothetical protein AAGF44_10125, partial [Pseudomonadota bacterium]
ASIDEVSSAISGDISRSISGAFSFDMSITTLSVASLSFVFRRAMSRSRFSLCLVADLTV